MSYFKILCFVWAFIGIGSRIIMGLMGEKWKEWELNSAYKAKRPIAISFLLAIGISVVIYTWVQVILTDVPLSWIIALLVSMVVIKIGTLIFNYDGFRKFAAETLNSKKKMMTLNAGVILYSLALVLIGLFLY